MVTIIAQAPEGEWIDAPEGASLSSRHGHVMNVIRFRRVGPDLDVADDRGNVWRFTDVAFTESRRTEVHGNTVVERPSVTWSRSI